MERLVFVEEVTNDGTGSTSKENVFGESRNRREKITTI
jgi:hypothetical protein